LSEERTSSFQEIRSVQLYCSAAVMKAEMNGKYGDWRDDAVLQLKALTSEHQQQRTQLELILETTPRDSRYSANLVNLMKAEEDDAGKDKVAMFELNREVDEALALETHNFFQRTAAQNVKRWKVLAQKLDNNFEKFRGVVSDEIIKINPNNNSLVSTTNSTTNAVNNVSPQQDSRAPRIPTAEEMDEESLRLEADYNNNFFAYEGFNLSEAFKSHKLKVDKDWSAHELLLEEDYKARRCMITGKKNEYEYEEFTVL
jgi:hypothetical protein